jgi:hypothetical protein
MFVWSARRLVARYLTIISMVAASVAIFALPAAADKPTQYEYPLLQSSILADVCSFPVVVDSVMDVTETVFTDASGAMTKIQRHIVEQDTFTANGKTLVGLPFTFNMQVLFDSSGNWTHAYSAGVVEKVPLPDGNLFVSAGRLDWADHLDATFVLSPDKGNPGNLAAFCAALSE